MTTQMPALKTLGPGGIDWNSCPGLWRDPGRMSGAWCFDQSRVPVSSLFQNLESGVTVKKFLDIFPMDNDWNVAGVLRHLSERLGNDPTSGPAESGAGPGAIDWRDYKGIEPDTNDGETKWVFKGTTRAIGELFEHMANGGSTDEYCSRFPEVRPDDTTELLEFLVRRLEAE